MSSGEKISKHLKYMINIIVEWIEKLPWEQGDWWVERKIKMLYSHYM